MDPLLLSADELEALERLGPPTHILLTCNYHVRESEAYRERWGCAILIHERGLKDAEVRMDGAFRDGDCLWNVIQVVPIPDVYWLEESAFLAKQEQGILIVGDTLCGGRADISVPEGEIGIFDMKYIADMEKARDSLCRLMEYPFEAMCFGHGSPVLHKPKEALRRFIEATFGKE